MIIEDIRIRNFKALKDVGLRKMPSLAVFVGRNGVGKTTLFRVFSFLKNCLAKNVRIALQNEGGFNGFKEVVTRGVDTSESIVIELKFRLWIAEKERLVTYRLEIGLENGRPLVRREILRYKRGQYGAPFHFISLIFPTAKVLRSATKKTSTNPTPCSREKSSLLILMCWPSTAWGNWSASRRRRRSVIWWSIGISQISTSTMRAARRATNQACIFPVRETTCLPSPSASKTNTLMFLKSC